MDYRYIYFLRRKGKNINCLMAVRVPFAYKREQRLHKMFSCSRFEMKLKQRTTMQAQCKIGIAANLPRRLGTIQANKLSGKTEWFYLTRLERLAVMYWLAGWWMQKVAVMAILAAILALGLIFFLY